MFFAGFPGLLGGASLFVPGYQYLFDVGGDDNRAAVSRSQIYLYFDILFASISLYLTNLVSKQTLMDDLYQNRSTATFVGSNNLIKNISE